MGWSRRHGSEAGPTTDHDHEVAPDRPGPAPAGPEQAELRPDHAQLLGLQRQAGNAAVVALLRASSQVAANPVVPTDSGAALPEEQRSAFEQALGHPFDHVRIHRGAEPDRAARALGAEAFTVGSDIYFAEGSYDPGTAAGDRRLGHELTHVVQHDAGRVPRADPSVEDGLVSSPGDVLEQEAYGQEEAVGRTASGVRAAGAGPVVPAARVATPGPPGQALRSTAPEEAAPTAGPGTGPSDDQLLPPVPEDAPPLAAAGGQTTTAPPAPATPTPPAPPAPPAQPAPAAPPAAPPGAAPPPTTWIDLPADGAPAPGPVPAPTPPGLVTDEAQTLTQEIAAQTQLTADRVAAEVARLVAAAQAAAAQARAELAEAYDAQVQAVVSGTAAAVATIAAARDAQQAALGAAGEAERQRLLDAHRAGSEGATAHVATLQQETVAAGETEAARVLAASAERATAILGEAEQVPVTGDPPSAQAQRESARRIAKRAADQCQQTGTQVAERVRQEAAHHAATTYDGMLRDHLAKLDEARTAAEPLVGELTRQAAVAIDRDAEQATAAAQALGSQAAATLGRERANALAEVDAWETQTSAALHQAGEQATRQLADTLAPVPADLLGAVGGAVDAAQAGPDPEPALAEVRTGLGTARDTVLSGVGQSTDTVVATLGALYDDLLGGLTGSVQQRRAAATETGTQLQQAIQAGADGAAGEMRDVVTSFQQRLGAGVTEAVEQMASGGQQFRTGTAEIHDQALTALAKAVDDGLASEDQLLAKARGEMSATAGQVAGRYDELKDEARRRSETEQPVPATRIHRGIWGAITGWVAGLHESAKKWFADTFGETLGGILLGVLEGLVIVAVGLLMTTVVGAIVGAFIAAAKVVAIVTIAIVLVVGVGLAIYNRFQEFYQDNPGQSAGFWRGLALVGLGIADLTGIPYIVEGLVGQRAFGAKMSRFDAMERLGMGIVFLGAVLVSAKNLFRSPRPEVVDQPVTRPAPEPKPAAAPPPGLTPKLEAIRAGLKNPKAIEQFDRMFTNVRGDSAKLERILDGFAAQGSVEDRLAADWDRQNPVPLPPRGAALGDVPAAKARAVALRDEMVRYSAEHPEVAGMGDRVKALDGEILGFDQMLDGRIEATPDSLDGRSNNVDGIDREFQAAKRTPGVTGMGAKFTLDGVPEAVDVDVVGEGGRLWIDTKSTEPFGLESSNWTGDATKQGLRAQAAKQLRAAQQNPVNGTPPRVRIEFPKGVGRDVKAALEAMGVEVGGPVIEPQPIPVPVPVGGHDQDNDGGT